MTEEKRKEYRQKYGTIGLQALWLIEISIIDFAKAALSEQGFKGRVNVDFDIESYDEQKSLLKLVRDLEKLDSKKKGLE